MKPVPLFHPVTRQPTIQKGNARVWSFSAWHLHPPEKMGGIYTTHPGSEMEVAFETSHGVSNPRTTEYLLQQLPAAPNMEIDFALEYWRGWAWACTLLWATLASHASLSTLSLSSTPDSSNSSSSSYLSSHTLRKPLWVLELLPKFLHVGVWVGEIQTGTCIIIWILIQGRALQQGNPHIGARRAKSKVAILTPCSFWEVPGPRKYVTKWRNTLNNSQAHASFTYLWGPDRGLGLPFAHLCDSSCGFGRGIAWNGARNSDRAGTCPRCPVQDIRTKGAIDFGLWTRSYDHPQTMVYGPQSL